MARLDGVLSARSIEDAAAIVVEALGPETSVWQTIRDERTLLAGRPHDGGAEAAVTGLCRGTIEVAADADSTLVDFAATLLAGASDRIEIEDRARSARRRLADSERLGVTGIYAWTAATEELEWTDGLIRIYGHDPGSFEPSYARFLEHLHPDDRDRVRDTHERAMRSGEPYETEERIVRPSGEVRTLASVGEVVLDDDGRPAGIVGVCRDITEQREAERRVADAELRRKQALELNDNVIQGLISLLWQLDGDAVDDVRSVAEATLASSRRMVADLLEGSDDAVTGKLVRRSAASLAHDGSAPAAADGAGPTLEVGGPGPPQPIAAAPPGTITVVVADDQPTLRTLVRWRLSEAQNVEVVAEARDGQEAVDLVVALQPTVAVIDLSMPVLDGLQATRRIRELSPATRVIVLSGYPAASMAHDALAAGAERYIEKSSNLDELCAVVADARAGYLGP